MATQKQSGALSLSGCADNQPSQPSVTMMGTWEKPGAMTITGGADNQLP